MLEFAFLPFSPFSSHFFFFLAGLLFGKYGLEKLKPRYKRLVELRYFQERSYEEIADELKLPLGTVKAQLFRAREFLYQILKNQEEQI